MGSDYSRQPARPVPLHARSVPNYEAAARRADHQHRINRLAARAPALRRVQHDQTRPVGADAGDRARRTRPWHIVRSEEHTSELQSLRHLVCRLLLEKKKKTSKLQLTFIKATQTKHEKQV